MKFKRFLHALKKGVDTGVRSVFENIRATREGYRYSAVDKIIECLHCGGKEFISRNPRWAAEHVLTCRRCGLYLFFEQPPVRLPRQTFEVQQELPPVRCEICHQADMFDPRTGGCSRCGRLIE